MKSITTLVLLLFAISAYSQNSNLEQDLKKLTELYQLDASQQSQVRPMLIEKHKALTEIATMKSKQKDKKKKQDIVIEEYDVKFYAVLNDEQKLAFERIKLINKAGKGANAHSSDEVNPALIQGAPTKAKEKATAK